MIRITWYCGNFPKLVRDNKAQLAMHRSGCKPVFLSHNGLVFHEHKTGTKNGTEGNNTNDICWKFHQQSFLVLFT